MIYEVLQDGWRVWLYPTEAVARLHAAYMPQGPYVLREWIEDGEFLVYNRETCRVLEIDTRD